ncbi:mandelate racemase/muconate lactonizing enzyme family protein [Marinimicrococcus flavescens]|uniref:Mandelate racemase/muconate lactonizing enzyme family protein n=1 Tax=Marinimicrococcus flavescens TaxID=3031815 RepID=A0AAP3XPA8_9PROT|nr:mandelate racemase/muconate lactonizing enzyme family protein [Marinimicrococcus flavescens]
MPQVRSVEAIALGYGFDESLAYGMARGLTSRRETTLIRLTTSDGVVGWGEAWGPSGATRAYLDLIRGYVEGSDLFAFQHVVSRILSTHYHFGIQNQMMSAISGLDIAIMDAQGRTLGLPVCQLIGGKARDRVPVYASGGYITRDPRADFPGMLARLEGARCGAVKIKIGISPSSDEERVRLARETLGRDVLLLVDSNGNYTLDLALESMARIAPYNVHWYEEPLAPQDFEGYRALRQRGPIPVATGEALYTAFEFKRLLDFGGADIVQPDLSLCGGLSQGRLIAQLAALHHVRLSPHVWGGAIGLAAACHYVASLPTYPHSLNVPRPTLVEYDVGDNALRDELLLEPVRLEGGELVLPEGPGLGVEPDPAAIERFRI